MTHRIARRREVCERLGISQATLWRWVKAGHFPSPVRLGPNSVGFVSDEIDQWLANRTKGASDAVA